MPTKQCFTLGREWLDNVSWNWRETWRWEPSGKAWSGSLDLVIDLQIQILSFRFKSRSTSSFGRGMLKKLLPYSMKNACLIGSSQGDLWKKGWKPNVYRQECCLVLTGTRDLRLLYQLKWRDFWALSFTQMYNVKFLCRIFMRGVAKVHWTESRSTGTRLGSYTEHYNAEVEYFFKRQVLFGGGKYASSWLLSVFGRLARKTLVKLCSQTLQEATCPLHSWSRTNWYILFISSCLYTGVKIKMEKREQWKTRFRQVPFWRDCFLFRRQLWCEGSLDRWSPWV